MLISYTPKLFLLDVCDLVFHQGGPAQMMIWCHPHGFATSSNPIPRSPYPQYHIFTVRTTRALHKRYREHPLLYIIYKNISRVSTNWLELSWSTRVGGGKLQSLTKNLAKTPNTKPTWKVRLSKQGIHSSKQGIHSSKHLLPFWYTITQEIINCDNEYPQQSFSGHLIH